jgi:branched-chain amino acid aminotransferase
VATPATPAATTSAGGEGNILRADHVWLDGKLLPFADAQVHVSAFTLHYGLGVFEGVRCYQRGDGGTVLFRLRDHITRLYESAKIAALDIPIAPAVVEAACLETVRANRLREGYVRPLAFTGAGMLGMGARNNPVQVAIIAFPWNAVLGAQAAQQGIRAHVSSYTRGPGNGMMSKAKIVGQYALSVMVKRDSQRLGYDEAIMLDGEGRVTEGSAENVFIVWQGQLFTPPLDLALLAGITRDSVITLARDAGLPVVERSFTRDMLYTASEVFLTGTATEITPVREIDGRMIGDGRPGPVTRRIQEAFFAAIRGPGTPQPDWLAPT